ncbi:MAG: protein-glutamate O-methyltransferase CheR [Polyangiales bacterium]
MTETGVYSQLRRWVRDRFGIVYADAQRESFEQRVEGLCHAAHVAPDQLLERVTHGDDILARRLGDVVSVNHTFFFREREAFEHLARVALPALPSGPVRIWSAASSTGEEAYSIAITAQEVLGAAATARVRILGTDISQRALEHAEAGLYSPPQVEAMDPARRLTWFASRGGERFEVAPALREMCMFRRLNLTQSPWPFTQRFHVIFLRNVLYYFEPDVRAQIMASTWECAEPGAWLVTSLTEPLFDVKTRWHAVRPAIYRKVA